MRRLPMIAGLLALALLFGCSGGNELDGSIGEAFDLSFTSVELRRSPTAFQVTYLRSDGREAVARITVATASLDLSKGFALEGEYAPGHPRATVTRAVDGEPLLTLPTIASGRMTLDDLPEPGKTMSGSFSLAFAEGGEAGAGRTMSGSFEGEVIEAR